MGIIEFFKKKNIVDKNIELKDNESSNIYYKTGELMCERDLLNNKIHGKVLWYNKSQNLQCEENYINGMRHGKTTWYQNNKIYSTGNYINGYKEGEWITYKISLKDPSYNHHMIQYYKNGLENGLRTYSNSNEDGIQFKNGIYISDLFPDEELEIKNDDQIKMNFKFQEKLDFIYGFGNWSLRSKLTDEEIESEEEYGLDPCMNFEGCNYTVRFNVNNHPLFVHESSYDSDSSGFNYFYTHEWFIVKNCENLNREDLTLLHGYVFFCYPDDDVLLGGGLENIKNRLFGNVLSIYGDYFGSDLGDGYKIINLGDIQSFSVVKEM